MTNGEKLLKRASVLQGEHSQWTGLWNKCARFCLPDEYPIATSPAAKTRGAGKQQPIDATGADCLMKLAAWLFSSTIYQGEQWFDIKARTKKAGDYSIIDTTLDKVLQAAARTALETIANSNCIQTYQRFLLGYCCYGTGAFYSEFDDDGELVCKQWDITDSVYISENAKGEIDTVFREFEFTARQAVQQFGEENLSEDIRKAASQPDEQEKRFLFVHAVYPRTRRDKQKKSPDNKPFASVYIEQKTKKVVYEGGYNTMPYQCPRFYKGGEIYGRSPAMKAIPALRSINIAVEAYLKNVEGQAKPIVFAPSKVYDKISLQFGTVNPWDSDGGEIKIWSPTGDLRSPIEFAQLKAQQVEKMFYCDVFQYLEDKKNMTATEAQLRYDEMIQGISPVLANLHSEFFSPFIKRVVNELFTMGKIKIPKEYTTKDGKMPDFEVVYNTRLDTKLKGVLNANIINFVRMVGELAVALANAPMAAAYLDVDKIVKLYARNNNVSNDALRSDKEIKEALEAQAQQQQQRQLMGMVNKIDLQKTPERGSQQDIMVNGVR